MAVGESSTGECGPGKMGKSMRTESACSGLYYNHRRRLNVFNFPLKLLLLV